MKPTVYVVNNNGNAFAESFETDGEAQNYAKLRSKTNFCTIYHTVNNKMFVYEDEEIAPAGRRAELVKQTEEMMLEKMSREVKQGQKKR